MANIKEELTAKRKKIRSRHDLIGFLIDVEENYNTSYDTAPEAIAQACLAVGYYLSNKFGITGFQAGWTMWQFIRGWSKTNNKTGLRLIDYDDMLYPQYDDEFGKTISSETWESLKTEAAKNLAESPGAHPNVVRHWQSIVDGEVPFGYKIRND